MLQKLLGAAARISVRLVLGDFPPRFIVPVFGNTREAVTGRYQTFDINFPVNWTSHRKLNSLTSYRPEQATKVDRLSQMGSF
jgi:hypothetical protein